MDQRRNRKSGVLCLVGVCALGVSAWCFCQNLPAADITKPADISKPAVNDNTPAAISNPTSAADWAEFQKTVKPFLVEHCISCHGDNNPEAGLSLNHFDDAASMLKATATLDKMLPMLRSRKMPPKDEARPSEDDYRKVVAWLDAYTVKADLLEPKNPGHVTIRRLNRAEYNNTIHDLLDIDFDPADAFPVDEAGYGFDNNGDVLSMAPMLLDKYLNAAALSLDRAIIVDPIAPPPSKRWDTSQLDGTVPKSDPTAHSADSGPFDHAMPNGRVFDYVGEIYTDYVFPAAGTYVFQVRAYGTQGSVTHQRPSVAFKVDGQQMGKPITIGGDQRNTAVSSTAAVKVSAGQHRISLAFLNGPTKDELTAAIATVAAAKAAAATRPGAVSTSATTNPSASGQSRGGQGQGQGQGQEQANGASRQGNPAAQPPLGLPASAAGSNSSGAGGGTAPVVASAQTSNTTAQNGPATAPVGVNGQRGGANGAGANGLGANGRNGAAGANGRGAAGGRGRGGGPPPPVLSPTGKPTLGVVYFEVEGPQEVSLDRMPDSYKKVFVALPSATVTKEQAARQIITNFAAKAYRRPARTEEVDRLMAYWSQIDRSGETFDKSIDAALQPVLASPNFLYRVEAQPSASDPGGIRTLNEYELASRLSYFLWSSMPDDELFNLAHDGKLRANLEPQVRRMMASPKSFAMVQNFAGQWLQLRQMENVTPDPKRFPEFDESLRDAMVKETQLYFSAIMTEDRSVLDFIDSDFTFMNEQLAKLYGRTDIKGDEFRRVALTGDQRGGVITQASVLTITSFPNRTSPVIRGKWVLENLLDEAPPPPPPDVPKLAETTQAEMTGTLRQRMETHRNNPNCVSCHAQMDPIGFGLENYDAIGAWRDNDTNNQVIDASGVLPDGTKFSGAGELKKILLDQKDQFCRCLTDRMMTFALGRGMEGYDRPMVNKIAAGLKDKDYKFSALILQIVESDAFQQLGSSAK